MSKGVTEDQDTSGVEQAILKRIMVAHLDLLRQYGPDKVMQAAEEVAYNVGDVDEIGTSDVSAYVQQVKQILGAVA
jgi:predicted oxidoreductase